MKKTIISVFGLVILALIGWYTVRQSAPSKPNIILMVLDTTRADHLGMYGYERDTSPVLDAFSKEAIKFSYAVTTAPWTPPSVATMITGLYPSSHKVMPPNSRDKALEQFHRLNDNLTTLAELLRDNGYATTGITPNPWTKEEFGYHQGYDKYQFLNREVAGPITTKAIEEIDRLGGKDAPFFLYLHYLDPHDPYTPPEAFTSLFSGPVNARAYDEKTLKKIGLYDGEIRYMDAEIGRLFQHLKNKGLYDSTAFVIVGDHGEQFKERGHQGHGFQLHNEELHVPLLVKAPGYASREVDFTVSTVDVYPTIADIAKLPKPSFAQGVSLLSDENSRDRTGVLSEITRIYSQKSITSFDGAKLILDYGKAGETTEQPSVGLFDRHKDYLELSSIDDKELLKELVSEFETLYSKYSVDTGAGSPQIGISDETVEQLKSLGYL